MANDSNLGVSGAIGLTTAEGSTVLVNVNVLAWKDDQQAAPLNVTGRGDSAPSFDSSDVSGSGFVTGEVRTDGYPVPASLKDQTGTLTLTFHYLRGAKKTIPIRVTSAGHARSNPDKPAVLTIGWVQTGAPTYSGFAGTQPGAGTAPTGDKQVHEGTTWTKDPDGLQTAGTARWRARDVGNTNADEWTALGTFIAAQVAPVAGLKLRGVNFQRSDLTGGWYVAQWGLTTTAEDFTNAQSRTAVDPAGITSQATAAAINGTPSAPSQGSGWVTASVATFELNDSNTATVTTFDLRTSAQGIEMDGSTARADAQDLEDGGPVTVVTSSSSPPSTPSAPGSSVLAYTDTTQINPGKWKHTFTFGPANTQQAKEYAGTTSVIDPAALRDAGTALVVNGSSTPPSPPTAPGTSKLVATESTRLTAGGKWQHVFRFGAQTSADEITQGGTVTRYDPQSLDPGGEITVLQSSATPAAAPAAPSSGSVHVATSVKAVKDGNYAVTYKYGPRTTADEITMDGTVTRDDAGDLEDGGEITVLQASATPASAPSSPVSGSVFVGTSVKQVKTGEYAVTYRYGPKTTADEVTFGGTISRVDPAAFAVNPFGTVTVIQSSATPASAPSAPVSGTVHVQTEVQQLRSGKFRVKYEYGPRTSNEELIFRATSHADPGELDDTAELIVLASSATPTAASAAPLTGTVHTGTTTRRVSQGVYEWKYEYGRVTTADKVVQENTAIYADTLGKNSWSTTASFGSIPTVLSGTAYAVTTKTINGQTYYITHGKALTQEQEEEFPRTRYQIDGKGLDTEATQAEVYSGSAPSTTAAPAGVTGVKLVGSVITPITGTYKVQQRVYGTLDSEEKRTFPETFQHFDFFEVGNKQVSAEVVDATGAAAAITAASVTLPGGNYKYVDTRVRPITPAIGTAAARSLLIHQYAAADAADRLTLPHLSSTDDVSDLNDEDFRAHLYAVADGFPSDPASSVAPATLKLVARRDVTVPDDAYNRVAVFAYGRQTAKDKLEQGNTTARYGTDRTWDRRDSTVVSCSAAATALSIASDSFGTALAATGAAGAISLQSVMAEKLHDTAARVTIEKRAADIIVRATAWGGLEWVGVVNAGGLLYVRVADVVPRGSSYWVKVVPQRSWVIRAEIEVERVSLTDTAGAVSFNTAYTGTINADAFLGLAAGTVAWVGRSLVENHSLGTNAHPYAPADKFRYRSNGIYDEGGIVPGWYLIGTSVTANTLVLASAFPFTATLLTSATYAGFLV